jgi:hypothetical protein
MAVVNYQIAKKKTLNRKLREEILKFTIEKYFYVFVVFTLE